VETITLARKLPLTQGKYAIVDDDDYEYLSRWSWHVSGWGYAQRTESKKAVLMHKQLMGTPNQVVDHVNRDILDNRRSNLRLATKQQNGANAKLSKRNKSGFKGVWYNASRKKWEAYIRPNGKKLHLGRYSTAEEAAGAYKKAATLHFGDFAS
jgi:hypothetical protein